jgi:hypothetical protein
MYYFVLTRRLPIVSVDPFKDWSIPQTKTTVVPPNTGAVKRPIVSTSKDGASSGASNAKEMRIVSYYATMLDLSKKVPVADQSDSEATRTPLHCQVILFRAL